MPRHTNFAWKCRNKLTEIRKKPIKEWITYPLAMMILNQVFLKACPVNHDLMDDDYNYILFEFNMNYTIESIRNGYIENKKKEKSKVKDDLLVRLGYSDKDILNRKD